MARALLLAALVSASARAAGTLELAGTGEFDHPSISGGPHAITAAGSPLEAFGLGCGASQVETYLSLLFGQAATDVVAADGSFTKSVLGMGGPVLLEAPAGALPPGTVVTLEGGCGMPSPSGGFSSLARPHGIHILSTSQPGRPVTLTFSYGSEPMDGVDPAKLVVARWSPETSAWLPQPTTVDPMGRTVAAKVEHFSDFEVFAYEPGAAISDGAKVFPNPLKPALGHTRFNFTGFPAETRFRIYTLLGQLLHETSADASGAASWDARNKSGAPVASGVYILQARSGGDVKTIKIAVER